MRALLTIVVLATTAGVTHTLHCKLDLVPLPQPNALEETLPTIGSLRLVSLGYDSLVADYYWMRSLEHFGTASFNDTGYPLLEPLLHRALSLDPYFKSAYTFAGRALTLPKMDPAKANALLEQGMKYRPDVWQIPYYLGFNLYYFQQDYARAAEILGIAATHADAPPLTAQLATRLAAQAGKPEIGIALVDSILERTSDEQLRAVYLERRKALQLDVEVNYLNRLVQRYSDERGTAPNKIEDFVAAGYLREPPHDPYDKPYYVANGRVQSESESARLRLKPRAAGATHADGWHIPYREDQVPPE